MAYDFGGLNLHNEGFGNKVQISMKPIKATEIRHQNQGFYVHNLATFVNYGTKIDVIWQGIYKFFFYIY